MTTELDPSPADDPQTEAVFEAMKAGASVPPPRQGTPFLVLQFFIFPMAIVAVCVVVFLVFGVIAAESKGARQYVDEVRTGSANRRWQAAFELSRVLQAGKDPALREPAFVDQVLSAFATASSEDPRVRRYLALALGRLGDRRAVPALREAAGAQSAGAPDADTQVYAVWALGAIGDEAALPDLLALARSEDAGLRKAAVHALGTFPAASAQAALAAALTDGVEDVRWNAALGLARRADPRSAPVLLEMMDRGTLARVPQLTRDQQEEALLEATKAAARVREGSLRGMLERLRDADPSLRVREAARSALASPSP